MFKQSALPTRPKGNFLPTMGTEGYRQQFVDSNPFLSDAQKQAVKADPQAIDPEARNAIGERMMSSQAAKQGLLAALQEGRMPEWMQQDSGNPEDSVLQMLTSSSVLPGGMRRNRYMPGGSPQKIDMRFGA